MFKNKCFPFWLLGLSMLYIMSCNSDSPLPVLGFPEITASGDTVLYSIPDFRLINQDSLWVSNQDLADNIYIADFFFMSCPSICPKVKKQMLRIYDKFGDNAQVKLVSHTIDPKRDTPDRLKQFAANLDVNTDKWIFLTGDKDSMMAMAEAYFVTAMEDADAPGGFDHSGKILLVDTKRHIRAFADGTDATEVDAFMKNIDKLLREYEQ